VRRTRRDLVVVGAFVVAGVSVLVGALLWIAGARIFEPRNVYRVVFARSVSGLAPGAVVEFQGVAVGRVRDLQLTADVPPRVEAVLDVRPGTPIRADTHAALVGSLVTGIKFIQLQGGSEESPPLPPGSLIHGDVASLEQFRDRAELIADRMLSILERLDTQVFTDANASKLSRFVNDMASITDQLRAAVDAFREQGTGPQLAQLVTQVRNVAARLDAVLAALQGRKEELLGGLASTVQHTDEAVQEVRKLTQALNTQLASTGGSVGTLLGDLAVLTQRLQETVDLIQTDPSLLLRGRAPRPEERQ
jgi:phospholipid/cholesterol/gamma-HCH transport system substrate-binding protein